MRFLLWKDFLRSLSMWQKLVFRLSAISSSCQLTLLDNYVYYVVAVLAVFCILAMVHYDNVVLLVC